MSTDASPRKKAVNIALDPALVDRARVYGLNISALAEEAIRARVRAEVALRWREENADAIAAYNRQVGRSGPLAGPGWQRG